METFYVLSASLQLTSLVTLGLLSQVGSSDPLESPKYKCLVSLDFVKSISRFVFYAVAVSSLFSYSTGYYMSDISPFFCNNNHVLVVMCSTVVFPAVSASLS